MKFSVWVLLNDVHSSSFAKTNGGVVGCREVLFLFGIQSL